MNGAQENARKVKISFVIACVAFACGACKQEPRGTVIARVGDVELTMERARTHIDSSRGAADFQLREYAANWTTTELLYREASRLGMDNTPELQQQLADVRRQLVTERYLATILTGNADDIIEDSAKAYFLAHGKEFLVRENMIRLHIMTSPSREQAGSFATSVVQRGSWGSAVKAFFPDSARPRGVNNDVPPQYYTQSTLYPPELWKVASSLGVNEVSFPVRSGESYYVLQLLNTAQQGKPADYEIVRDEVRQRIIIERKRRQYADLLGTLRSRYTVELLLSGVASPDSTRGPIHE